MYAKAQKHNKILRETIEKTSDVSSVIDYCLGIDILELTTLISKDLMFLLNRYCDYSVTFA